MEEGNDMQDDLFFGDLDGIFDDDGASDEFLSFDGADDYDASSEAGESIASGPLENTASTSVSTLKRATSEPSRKRRSGREIEGRFRGLPPPRWHSDAADRPHRQAMVLEVYVTQVYLFYLALSVLDTVLQSNLCQIYRARLLQTRKKTHPTAEWLQQLPHKARKLEERLYLSAPSLEAYLDKTTLKNRLKKLAQTITKQFFEAKRGRRSIRSSVSSQSTLGSSITSQPSSVSTLRNSVTSVNSLQSVRETLAGGATRSDPNPNASSQTAQETDSAAQNGRNPSMTSPHESLSFLKPIPEAMISGHSAGGANSASISAEGVAFASQQQQQQRSSFSQSAPVDIPDLERQKAVNAQLQQQIMENIRQQQELVRKLQGPNALASLSNNHVTTAPNPASISNNSAGPAPSNRSSSASSSADFDSGRRNSALAQSLQFANAPGVAGGASHLNSTLYAAQAALMSGGLAGQFQGSGRPLVPPPPMANTSLIAQTNRSMLHQSFLQATAQCMTPMQLQQQLSFMRGSGMLANPAMMAAFSQSPFNPVVPGIGPASTGGVNVSMPPPNVGQRSTSATQTSQQGGAKKVKRGEQQDSEPWSPGSFKW